MAEHTLGPWVGFNIDGKLDAIMPAGRDGDVCTFRRPPSDADARLIMAAPALLKALETLDSLIDFSDDNVENVWTFEDTTAIEMAFERARDALALTSAERATVGDK